MTPLPPRDCSAVFLERRALAEAVLAGDEQHRVVVHERRADDVIAFLRADAPDADGVAALVAHFLFVETNAHPVVGDEHDFVDGRSVSLQSMRRSPSSILIAMMPPLRMFLKSLRFDFFTMPLRVAKTMCSLSFQVSSSVFWPWMRMVAAIFSSARSSSRFAMLRPLLTRANLREFQTRARRSSGRLW